MKYYRIKKEKYFYNGKKSIILVRDELITLNEWNKLGLNADRLNEYIELIEVSKKKVFWFFGARFEMD